MNKRLQLLGLVLAAVVPAPVLAQAESSWTDRITLDGDTRLRWETIDVDGSESRQRARFRARFGLEAEASDDLSLVFRIATGSGSPVSTNVTMDSGFSAKDINIDRAYVNWRVNDEWRVHAGKVKLPWYRAGGNQLIWDNDLNPEGIVGHYRSGALFGSVGAFAVEERSAGDDSLLLTLQGAWKGQVGDGSLTAGASYFAYTESAGGQPFFDGDPAGNTVDALGNYVNDYRLVELFSEYRLKLERLPLTLHANLVDNTAADDENLAYSIGATIGSASEAGRLQFGYAWHDTEADAVVATFNDSNVAGGETDSRGHVIRSKYALRDNVDLGGTLIVAERGLTAGNEQDYFRFMLDIQFSFE